MTAIKLLEGVTAVQFVRGVGAAFCGWLLRECGARITWVVPDSAATLTKLPWSVLTAGLPRVSLSATPAELDALLDGADLLITDLTPAEQEQLEIEDRRMLFPRLVTVSVTPFGLTGPHRDWKATSLIEQAAGGLLYTTGWPDRPPLVLAGELPQIVAGVNAALAGLTALLDQRECGTGQLVDVSVQESLVTILQNVTTAYAFNGRIPIRTGDGHGGHYMTVVTCRDGDVGINTVTPESWEMLCFWSGHPEWLSDPRFATGPLRSQHAATIDAEIKPWAAGFDKRTFEEEGQRYRIPVSLIAGMGDILNSPQHAERDYFRIVDDPEFGELPVPTLPFRVTAASSAPPDHPPSPDPVRVLDLSRWWAGPLAGRLLADYGMDVVKIEALDRYDPWRGNPNPAPQQGRQYPNLDPGPRPYNRSALYTTQNRNKRSLPLDIARPAGRDVFLRMVANADVVMENFSARVMSNLNLAYRELSDVRPGLIMLSMPAFGGSGPQRDYVAFGGSVEWITGLSARNGFADRRMMTTGMAMGDPVAGLFGAFALTAALVHRQRGGEGVHLDLSQVEASTLLNLDALVMYAQSGHEPARQGNSHPEYAPHGVFPALGEDMWVALAVTDNTEWQALCCALDAEDLAGNPALATAAGRRAAGGYIEQRIATWTSGRTAGDCATSLQAAGVPAAPVQRAPELLADSQLAARSFFIALEHAEVGRYPFPGFSSKIERPRRQAWRAAPAFGEHRREVLKELGGLTDADVDALEAAGMTGGAPRLREAAD